MYAMMSFRQVVRYNEIIGILCCDNTIFGVMHPNQRVVSIIDIYSSMKKTFDICIPNLRPGASQVQILSRVPIITIVRPVVQVLDVDLSQMCHTIVGKIVSKVCREDIECVEANDRVDTQPLFYVHCRLSNQDNR